MLFEPGFLQKLENLALLTRRPFSGVIKGDRRSLRRGSSVDFADFREYVPGDDLRYVDWRAYARLEKVFLKLFMEEDDLSLHLIVDSSRSMGFGSPTTKFDYARRLAAALGFIGLMEQDRVDIAAIDTGLGKCAAPLRGRAHVQELFRFFDSLPDPSGKTALGPALRRYGESVKTPGVAVVCSDFFDATAWEGLKALRAHRNQVVLMHILDAEEINPSLTGDLRLVDSETSEAREVYLSLGVLEQYRARVKSFCDDLQATASRYGMDYVQIITDQPLEDVIFHALRRAGLVK